ncbi:hypothetical protein D3C86_1819360 [compost metagenome]
MASRSLEALRPDCTPDSVDLCGRTIPIKFMPIEKEEEIIKLLLPVIPRLFALIPDTTPPGEVKVTGVKASDVTTLIPELLPILPQAVAIIASPAVDLAWIRSNCSIFDLVPVAVAQVQKYGVQDLLGKLSGLSGRLKTIAAEAQKFRMPS